MKTSTAPLDRKPIMPANHLLDRIAKIMPSIEREPRIVIAKGKLALGPLRIKNIKTLTKAIIIEKAPNLFIYNHPFFQKSMDLLPLCLKG